jgi:hypothetical protein
MQYLAAYLGALLSSVEVDVSRKLERRHELHAQARRGAEMDSSSVDGEGGVPENGVKSALKWRESALIGPGELIDQE